MLHSSHLPTPMICCFHTSLKTEYCEIYPDGERDGSTSSEFSWCYCCRPLLTGCECPVQTRAHRHVNVNRSVNRYTYSHRNTRRRTQANWSITETARIVMGGGTGERRNKRTHRQLWKLTGRHKIVTIHVTSPFFLYYEITPLNK